MRVQANRRNISSPIQEEKPQHQNSYKQELISTIKSNLDHLNNSRQQQHQQHFKDPSNRTTDSDLLSRNLDKVMFETIDSTIRDTSLLKNSHYNTQKSMNFSLLNKVQMDATAECTVNDRHNSSAPTPLADIEETFDVFNEPNKVKNVQFGNTYILNSSAQPTSTEESTQARPAPRDTQRQQSLTNESRSFDDTLTRNDTQDSVGNNRNIFMDNRDQYEDDFYSSVESSEKVTPRSPRKASVGGSGGDFFEREASDCGDNSYGEIEYLGITGDDDILRSGSKYSNNYNSKSFVTDSLATRDSVRSSISSRNN